MSGLTFRGLPPLVREHAPRIKPHFATRRIADKDYHSASDANGDGMAFLDPERVLNPTNFEHAMAADFRPSELTML